MAIFRLSPVVLLSIAACGPRPGPVPPSPPAASVCKTSPEPEPQLVLEQTTFDALDGWRDDRQFGALLAFRKSCETLRKRSDDWPLGKNAAAGVAGDWRTLCADASKVPEQNDAAARRFFETHFVPYAAANHGQRIGKFTGYYEAKMRGSRRRHGPYQTPIYKEPDDVITVRLDDFTSEGKGRILVGRLSGKRLRLYYSRQEINDGALEGRKLEVLWVDDPIDAFFTQIQGSGMVELDDGTTVRVGYDGKNGRPYTAIGRVLVEEEGLTPEQASMQGIRKWLEENPKRAKEIMERNRAFAFLDIVERNGAVGSQGVDLTGERSLAVDREFIALSTPIWISTTVPVARQPGERPFRQLVIAQDTGGGIKGPVRGDIFWGSTDDAADIAGRLKSEGVYYLFVPTAVAARIGSHYVHSHD